ncbi:FecR family protein [Thiothrix nivea]|nr:FecR family protein [Thiothrix nivea]
MMLNILFVQPAVADVSPTEEPVLAEGMIGKVTYILGQADVVTPDGAVSPLALQMEIPQGSRVQVRERSRVNLLMADGGIEKLGPDTIFMFDEYAYDPDNVRATEIRKTLIEGEVTSATGKGGESAKDRYRLNSPLAAIAVLGTEYTVRADAGETWITVHSGKVSVAKLGGSCLRSGLGACAGGEFLSETQRGFALVVRSGSPKPELAPVSAIPVSRDATEAAPADQESSTATTATANPQEAPDTAGTASTGTGQVAVTAPTGNTAAEPAATGKATTGNTAAVTAPTTGSGGESKVSPVGMEPKATTQTPAVATAVLENKTGSVSQTATATQSVSLVAAATKAANSVVTETPIWVIATTAAAKTAVRDERNPLDNIFAATETAPKETAPAISEPAAGVVAAASAPATSVEATAVATVTPTPVSTTPAPVQALADSVVASSMTATTSDSTRAVVTQENMPSIVSVPEKPPVETLAVVKTPDRPTIAVVEPVTPPVSGVAVKQVDDPPSIVSVPEKPPVGTLAVVKTPDRPTIAVVEPVTPPVSGVAVEWVDDPPSIVSVPEKPPVATLAEESTAAVVAPPDSVSLLASSSSNSAVAVVSADKGGTPSTLNNSSKTVVPSRQRAAEPIPDMSRETAAPVKPETDSLKPVTAASVAAAPTSETSLSSSRLVLPTTAVVSSQTEASSARAVETKSAASVRWGKYDPSTVVAGTTSLGEQVDKDYQQLAQRPSASTPDLAGQQFATAILPEQRDVSFVLGSYDAHIRDAGTGAQTAAGIDNAHLRVSPVRNAYDTGFTLVSPDYTGKVSSTGSFSNTTGVLGDDGRNPQTRLQGNVSVANGAAAASYTFNHQIAPQLSADGTLNWSGGAVSPQPASVAP